MPLYKSEKVAAEKNGIGLGLAIAILDIIRMRALQKADSANNPVSNREPKLKNLIPKDLVKTLENQTWINKLRIKQTFSKELRSWSENIEVKEKIQKGETEYFEEQYRYMCFQNFQVFILNFFNF